MTDVDLILVLAILLCLFWSFVNIECTLYIGRKKKRKEEREEDKNEISKAKEKVQEDAREAKTKARQLIDKYCGAHERFIQAQALLDKINERLIRGQARLDELLGLLNECNAGEGVSNLYKLPLLESCNQHKQLVSVIHHGVLWLTYNLSQSKAELDDAHAEMKKYIASTQSTMIKM